MAEDTPEGFTDYKPPAPDPSIPAGFKDYVAPERPKSPPGAIPWDTSVAEKLSSEGSLGHVLNAFGQGFKEEWGSAKFAPDLMKLLEDKGVLESGNRMGTTNPAKAFNEAFVRPAVNALDVGLRTITGVAKGIHDAGAAAPPETGLNAVPALMEAFPLFGAELGRLGWKPPTIQKPVVTGGKGDIPNIPVAKDLNVIGIERPPLSEGTPAEAIANRMPPLTAYHGSPYSFDAFSMEKIGTGEGAQAYGHGIYLAEHPEVAMEYKKQLSEGYPSNSPEAFAATELEVSKGDRAQAIKNAEELLGRMETGPNKDATVKSIELLKSGFEPEVGNHYQVRVHANPDHFLDWDKPLSEQSQHVQDALKTFDLEALAATDPSLSGASLLDRMKRAYGGNGESVSHVINEAGIVGIKYLDQASRFKTLEATKAALAERIAARDEVLKGHPGRDPRVEQFALEEANKEIAGLEKQIQDFKPTRNMVVFNDKDIEITHRNGEPVQRNLPALAEDQSLVKRSSTEVGSPMEATPWTDSFDQWVGKLEVPEDVKRLIRNAAAENKTFPEARAGQIPEQRLGELSDITGIPRDQLPEAQMRQTFKNDAEFRVAAQLMIKTNDDVFAAAREHRGMPSHDSRTALVAAIMRRDLALETVLGLRAEWGRTGNVMQEFLLASQDAQSLGRFIKSKKGEGWNSAKLDEVADQLGGMNSRESVSRYLSELRKPDFIDKALWYWVNSILSGPITHTKYVFANAAYVAHDTFIATPMAGVSGAVRQALSREQVERVYLGETAAKTYGLIAGVPDALYAAAKAAKENSPTLLPPQVQAMNAAKAAAEAKGVPFDQSNPVTGIKGNNPFTGKLTKSAGDLMGVPSRGISAIHSFFNFLGYRAEVEAQAYRQAAKTYSPLDREFWRAQQDHKNFPDDKAMDAAILAGQRANFVQDLGPAGQSLQSFLYKTRLGRFIMPFLKVPGNIFNSIQEGTPFAFLEQRSRADLSGKNGGAAKDMAIGRMAAGGAVMGFFSYLTLQDKVTGNGPIEPKQRAEWLLTHQPRSVRIGDTWKSMDQWGPVGGWLSLSADLTDATQAYSEALDKDKITATDKKRMDADFTEAYARVVHGFAHWFEEGGSMGLFNFIEALSEPEKTRASSAGQTAGSMMPFSSGQSQIASIMDPYVRDQKTFIDGIKARIPGVRETLPITRDWTGAPKPNPAYGSIVKNRSAAADPVSEEMQRLDLKPTPVPDQIKGVKLTREELGDFQDHAAIATTLALNKLVTAPGWDRNPDFARAKIIEGQIGAARRQAEVYMQATYPHLISEATDERLRGIMGTKPLPGAYQRP